MSKVKISSISKEERMKLIGDLFDIVYGLKTKSNTVDFLVGLLTPSESLMLARRIQIGKLLLEEKTYEEIRVKLKVSHHTISGVENWMNARGGAYRKILQRWLERKKREEARKEKRVNAYKPKGLLDRYPQHRFLKELLGL